MTDSPEQVTLFAIGGPKHGQAIPIQPGSSSYLDLITATTYYVKPMSYIRRDPVTMGATALYRVGVLVHESLIQNGQDTPISVQAKNQAVSQMWTDVIMADWMAANGEQQPLNEVPAHMRNPRITTRPAGDQN